MATLRIIFSGRLRFAVCCFSLCIFVFIFFLPYLGKLLTKEQQKIWDEVEKEREKLDNMHKQMDAEVEQAINDATPDKKKTYKGQTTMVVSKEKKESIRKSIEKKYMDKLNNNTNNSAAITPSNTGKATTPSNISELKIVENFEFGGYYKPDDFEAFESEDTLSILNRYVQEAEIDLDKSRIQKHIQNTYQKACEMV